MNFYAERDSTELELIKLRRRGHCLNLLDLDPLVVDALRGTMYENKWRGTLTEYMEQVDLKSLVSATLARLQQLPESKTYAPVPNLPLPTIGLGTFGWNYDTNVIKAAIESNIQLIDTAESYGYGKVEKVLGVWLKNIDDMIIATKVSRNHMSYQATLNAARRSLKALDGVDLYQVHWPVMDKLPETVRAMTELMDNQEIWSVGVSNFSIDQVEFVLPECPYGLRSVQVRYNLIDRGIERALLPYCQEKGIAVIAYSPLGQGFGKIMNSGAAHALVDVAKACSASEAQVALAWIISHGVTPIPRTNNVKHVKEIAESRYLALDKAQIDQLEEAFPITE